MSSVDTIMAAFLRAILLRMKELGLNQSALARRMNVSRAYVSKVLQGGDVHFTFASALRFAKALEMDFVPVLKKTRRSRSAKAGDRNVKPEASVLGDPAQRRVCN